MLAEMKEFLDEMDTLVMAFNHRNNSNIEFAKGDWSSWVPAMRYLQMQLWNKHAVQLQTHLPIDQFDELHLLV
jgi:hypothetical protein